jgi:hypothetical protein
MRYEYPFPCRGPESGLGRRVPFPAESRLRVIQEKSFYPNSLCEMNSAISPKGFLPLDFLRILLFEGASDSSLAKFHRLTLGVSTFSPVFAFEGVLA